MEQLLYLYSFTIELSDRREMEQLFYTHSFTIELTDHREMEQVLYTSLGYSFTIAIQ